jgi:hypothetical protein
LAKAISSDVGGMRQKYTKNDPRVIGFVSMQFHYTSQVLLNQLSPLERAIVSAYFKVIDDHLYMPLQRAYTAAAKLDYESPALMPYFQVLWQMFSPQVFGELGLEKKPSQSESHEWESLFA